MRARLGRDAWLHDNERGLALAANGEWAEASEAFATAADALSRALPSDESDAREPLALVLGNLAHAYFHCGRVDDALRQARQTCALRAAIAGEGGLTVARARMDLAVILASAGRFDQAMALMQHALSAVEHHDGGENAPLAIALENAARIALAAGHAADAESSLRRLLALPGTHAPATARAERLLARVEQAWDDLPLRDAVAVTDTLLRTTPSGVPVLPELDKVVLPSPMPEAPAPAHADRGAGERSQRAQIAPRRVVLPEPEPSANHRMRWPIVAGIVVLGGGAAAFLLLR